MYYFKIKCSMLFFFCVYVILCFGSGNKVNFLFFFICENDFNKFDIFMFFRCFIIN